jgi:hypothetical protein
MSRWSGLEDRTTKEEPRTVRHSQDLEQAKAGRIAPKLSATKRKIIAKKAVKVVGLKNKAQNLTDST